MNSSILNEKFSGWLSQCSGSVGWAARSTDLILLELGGGGGGGGVAETVKGRFIKLSGTNNNNRSHPTTHHHSLCCCISSTMKYMRHTLTKQCLRHLLVQHNF